jgi:hypothetical protein
MKNSLSLFAVIILSAVQIQANVPIDSTRTLWSDFNTKIKGVVPMDTVNYTYFYSSPRGEKIDSLRSADSEDWIIVTIDSLKDGWVKLIDVYLVPSRPGSVFNNVWVPLNILYTGLNDPINTFKMHVSPSKDSEQVVYRTGSWLNIIDIKGLWLKLRYEIDGKEYVGWKHNYNVCPNPWSTCGWRPPVE